MISVLAQFPRNMFRGEVLGFDQQVAPTERLFFYLLLEHSESLTDQGTGDRADPRAWRCRIVEMGGITRRYYSPLRSFPALNAVFGRASIPAERSYLDNDGFAG